MIENSVVGLGHPREFSEHFVNHQQQGICSILQEQERVIGKIIKCFET